jgi:hypothetical protein
VLIASGRSVDAYLRRVVEVATADHAAALAAVTTRAATVRGLVVDFILDGKASAPSPEVLAVEADEKFLFEAGPWLIGFVREALLSASDRRRGGVHHTDPALAGEVAGLAIELLDRPHVEIVVVDPAVGGGVFLLAAAERLKAPPTEVVSRLHGCDIDPMAVAATRAALTIWSGGIEPPSANLQVVDYLGPTVKVPSADLVIGNPPFLSQLKGTTARATSERRNLANRWPGVGRYVDTAAAFMLAAVDGLVAGGVWALIQPDSVLGASDAAPVRARLAATAPVERIWIDDARRFDAAIDTVALIGREGSSGEVTVFGGVPASESGVVSLPSPKSWAPLLAPARGVPTVREIAVAGTLGDLAVTTAGFRDQFYGLRHAVKEDEHTAVKLITSGLIDPLVNRWGTTSCRYDKRAWLHPAVVLELVADDIRDWVTARLRPKVLVASQTPTVEAIADQDGVFVPCTPVVTVEPHDPDDVWRIAALLTCPVTSALLAQAASGTALSANALRVSASRLAELPIPADDGAWMAAAMAARAGDVVATGAAMQQAFGIDDPVLVRWWHSRLPNRGAE